MRTKHGTCFALSSDTVERLDRFADYLGMSRSQVVERILSFRLPLLTDELPRDVNEPPERKAA
jgi:hypothetical protein